MKTIKVKGMTCNHCVMAVEKALNAIDGISDVKVDLDRGEASFEQDATVDIKAVHQAIAKAGYEIG